MHFGYIREQKSQKSLFSRILYPSKSIKPINNRYNKWLCSVLQSYRCYGTKEKAEQSKGTWNLEWQGCVLFSSCDIKVGGLGQPPQGETWAKFWEVERVGWSRMFQIEARSRA